MVEAFLEWKLKSKVPISYILFFLGEKGLFVLDSDHGPIVTGLPYFHLEEICELKSIDFYTNRKLTFCVNIICEIKQSHSSTVFLMCFLCLFKVCSIIHVSRGLHIIKESIYDIATLFLASYFQNVNYGVFWK